ncbi:MAG: NAD(P)/FAD-dependent oxidoreductase, partial [Sphingomonas sp.]
MDDCIIIGAGPAGLTAAIYLARFHLSIRLFDSGSSRAAMIPCTHNHAGYPEGIAGKDLLGLMLAQAEKYGAHREEKKVTAITPDGENFEVVTDHGRYRA